MGDSTMAAFQFLDGKNGSGYLTMKKWMERFEDLKCNKFKGKDEPARIQAIFRYMDESGEGQVSLDEFQLIDEYWNEIQLSVNEFLQFCLRTYGNLTEAWAALDEDQGGSIDEEEWHAVLE